MKGIKISVFFCVRSNAIYDFTLEEENVPGTSPWVLPMIIALNKRFCQIFVTLISTTHSRTRAIPTVCVHLWFWVNALVMACSFTYEDVRYWYTCIFTVFPCLGFPVGGSQKGTAFMFRSLTSDVLNLAHRFGRADGLQWSQHPGIHTLCKVSIKSRLNLVTCF